MSATTVNMAAILKTLYPGGNLPKDATYKNNPFLALLPKSENFYGKDMDIPLKYAPNPGRSSAFATAQTNSGNISNVAFRITRNSDYAVAKITNELILASKNNSGAFISALKQEIDGAHQNMSNSLAQSVWGSGSGVIGQIHAGVTLASTTLTLRDPETVVHFEKGQVLSLSAANGGGAVRAGSLTVAAVDRENGVITTSANISTGVAAASVNDYISIQGDYDAKLKGVQAWIPSTAPTSGDSFFSVDRSVDPTRLAGFRGDYSALPIEEALIAGGMKIGRDGGSVDHVFLSFNKYKDLTNALGSKCQYVDVISKDAHIGFQGVKVNLGKSIATVIPDRSCPDNKMGMFQMDTWNLQSLEGCPMILDMDGLKMLRVSNADEAEIRVGYYAQLSCNLPGANGLFTI
jgi:hypothetical protein